MGRAVYESCLPIAQGCRLFRCLQEAQERGIALPPSMELLFHLIQVEVMLQTSHWSTGLQQIQAEIGPAGSSRQKEHSAGSMEPFIPLAASLASTGITATGRLWPCSLCHS